MENIISMLEKLNFSKMESKVYTILLKHSQMNGSQISKVLNVSRSSVYLALNHLYSKGAVMLLPGGTNIYKAQTPEVFIENIKSDYNTVANQLKNDLNNIGQYELDENYWNIKGYTNFVLKVKEIILNAKEEILINSSFELSIFEEEIKSAIINGIRVIHFSFDEHKSKIEGVEDYFYSQKQEDKQIKEKRMMLVADYNTTLIAGGVDKENILSIVTSNSLITSIVTEHIHHDLYFLKLEKKTKSPLFDESVLIGSIQERKFKEKVEEFDK